MDVLVISGKTAKTIISGKYEIIISPLVSILSILKKRPEVVYPKFLDAKAIINEDLLWEFRKLEFTEDSFSNFIRESKERLEMSKEHVELDKKEGDILESNAVIYSLLLRLRAFHMIKCILKKKKYTNKDFQRLVMRKTRISKKEYEKIYEIYMAVRDDKKIKTRVEIVVAEKLLGLLEKEIKKYDQKKKKT